MLITYATEDGAIFETHSDDVGGLIAAIKETNTLTFQYRHFKFDGFELNHFEEDGTYKPQLMVYLTEIIRDAE